MKQLLIALAAVFVIGSASVSVEPAIAQTKKTTTKKSTAKKKVVKKRKTVSRRGRLYLTAYAKNGRQSKAGKFGRQITLRTTKSAVKKTKSKLPIQGHTESISLCSKTYYTTKRGKSWVAAHRRARHTLVVRRWVSKGKYAAVCGKIPKRTKVTPAKTKRKKTVKKTTKKSS